MRFRFASALLLTAACGLAACSPAAEPTATPGAPATARPAIIPTYAFVPPTVAPQIGTAISTVTSAAPAAELEPTAVARGRDRYVALTCAECHGDNGDGIDGVDGGALTALTLTESEFITFMRSGGDLGVDHQYSTNRLSESGGRNLYLYLLSLQNE